MTERSWRVLVLTFGLGLLAYAQVDPRRDGNWWIFLKTDSKADYVIGFFDGMALGTNVSLWQPQEKGSTLVYKMVDSFNKLMNNVPSDQVAAGLDKFYSDYRNRRILAVDAVWVVLNSIAGKSDKEIQVMTEDYRKHAAR